MSALCVIVPCRNEAAVIRRKLRNLARCEWPRTAARHRVLVVDDGSEDGTARIARQEAERNAAAPFTVEVLPNAVRPGKVGALETALRAIGEADELIVLSDADVVLSPQALVALAAEFERDARIGMVTGSQVFVESLADDGAIAGAEGRALAAAGSFYDRASALVRMLESRFGLVFSMHGQLMAWRRSLRLVPTPGVAADDLDLMLQARVAGARLVRCGAARFYEVRAPRGEARRQQAIRRARAFHQFLRHPRIGELRRSGSWLARRQASFYLQAGRARGPWTAIALGSIFLAGWYMGPGSAMAVAALNALLFLPAWVLLRIVRSRMEIAEALEARSPMGERWETARR